MPVSSNIFNPQLVESADAETVDTEGRLYIPLQGMNWQTQNE